MAELTPLERLQPSLLDRLTDDEPNKKKESRNKRVLSLRQLRECVLRDLSWLFNTGNLNETESLEEYPQVANSVLNYGIPGLSGLTASSIDVVVVERIIRQAIQEFEPRILRNSVKVRAEISKDKMNHNALTFNIEGELWAQPIPLRVFMKTEIDLESGAAKVTEYG